MDLDQLVYDIKYELAEGIHTYHQCGCGENSTRRGECVKCLIKNHTEQLQAEISNIKEICNNYDEFGKVFDEARLSPLAERVLGIIGELEAEQSKHNIECKNSTKP